MSVDSTPPAAPEGAPAAPAAPDPAAAFAHLKQALGPAGANAWLARLMDGGTPDLAAQELLGAAVGPERSLRIQAALASAIASRLPAALQGVGLDPGRHVPALDVFVKERGFRTSAFLAAVYGSSDVQGVLDMAASAYAADVRSRQEPSDARRVWRR